MHSIKSDRLEAGVLFAIQQQVHLAVAYSELVFRINSAPLKKQVKAAGGCHRRKRKKRAC